MYLNYFGLVEPPFSIAPDPQYLYMSERHREAMAHLSFGLSQGGCFIVLTGEVGTGKTTLCRNLLAELPNNVDVALILNPNLDGDELLETICDELGLEYPEKRSHKKMLDLINEYLLRTYAENRHTVLIIDEAQLLSRSVLEQIRLLTNLETTKAKLLQIILVGQPELNDLLARNDLRQLAQRVTARYHLPALAKNEIQDYVNFRLGVAGCKKPLFSAQALKQLHQLSGGIPRKINVLADHALLATYAKSAPIVDAKTVKQCADEVFIKPQQNKRFQPQKWWLAIPAILALNLGLWWWFAADKASDDIVPNAAAPATVADGGQFEAQSAESDLVADIQPSEAAGGTSGEVTQAEQINLAKLVSQQQSQPQELTTIVKPEGVTPGTVVISEELLEDDEAIEQQSRVIVAEPELAPPAYLATSAFGRVLEVSPDRTGRVAAFRNLAAAWDVDLPTSLLGPLCDELAKDSVECLSVSSWNTLLRYNRPAIMVLEHAGKQHRVILYKVESGLAKVLVGAQTYDLPVAELLDRWNNSAVVFWRPGIVGDEFLQLGSNSELLPAVKVQLNRVFSKLGLPLVANLESTVFDAELANRVRKLQKDYGILSDGKIGKETYLLINELLNSDAVPTLITRKSQV